MAQTRKFPSLRYVLLAGIGLIIALTAVGIVGWYTYSRPTLPTSDYQVLYTADGYSPDFLEVPLNARVSFRNVSGFPLWTASDPHPLHSDYAPFDAQRDYWKGEEYIYQFNQTGTYGFHNHEKSIDRGIIRVIDPTNPLPNIDKTKQSQRVVRDTFLAYLEAGNPDSIFDLIDAIEADNAFSRDCHDVAHDVGHRAYELFGFSTAMTFSNPQRSSHTSADDICAGGYIHGILEALFLHRPELKQQPGIMCAAIPDLNRDSCFHGVGHGLMFVNKRNVPPSLAACRNLENATDTYRCFEGVWMEMFWGTTDHAGADSLGWTLEQPLAPCKNAQKDEKPTCFLYAHLGYLRTHPRNLTGAIDLCTKNGLVESDARFCLKGVGITMMKHFTSRNLERTESLVAHLDAEKKYAYYEGVIGYARLSGVSESSLQNFCALLKTDGETCAAVLRNVPR